MKKILLAAALFIAVGVHAQILNNDFENWGIDTIFFPGISPIPPDTFLAPNPAGWTTSNSLTGADSLGGVFFVTETHDAHSGSSAISLFTDTITAPVIPNVPSKLTIPGFALNGKFPISFNSLASSTVVSPTSVKGAGQPFTTRLATIKGFYKYDPVYLPGKNRYDSCIVWATLRKGPVAVADAIFTSSDSTGAYRPFTATFRYNTCDIPDTLTILIASSIPNLFDILNGQTGLQRGSLLFIDSLYYDTLAANYNFPPIARADLDTTYINTAKAIAVKANDEDCTNPVSALTLTVTTAPTKGTAVVSGSGITYTPNANFVGVDSFFYTLNDGNSLSQPARVKMLVFDNSGINDITQIPVIVYPVPANNTLNIHCDYNGKLSAHVYDIVGNVVINGQINSSTSAISTSELAAGIYGLQLVNEKGQVVAHSKFTVAK